MSATLIATESAAAERAARARILVVDDEPSLLRLLSFNLSHAGYEVLTAETDEAALEIVGSHEIDLILLDVMLPGIDGLEALRRLRRLDVDVPVIVMTAHGSIENAVEAMKLGARDFLMKPFEMERLSIAVRNALDLGRLARTVQDLRAQLSARYSFGVIVGAGGGLRDTVRLLEKVIPTDLTVLLQGESGTGKELFARALHQEGPRRQGPFVTINAAALPETLLESELFGYERGAFTGAARARAGKFEAADGGTLFLDEVADMSPALQVKLLRAIQEKSVTRLGGSASIPVDARIVCATNRDLGTLVAEGSFREDLFYRLAVFPITIPPLRERKEDIPVLARHILAESGMTRLHAVHPHAMELLEAHAWPGNVREMQNVLRRAVVLAGGETIRAEHLPQALQAGGVRAAAVAGADPDAFHRVGERLATIDELERRHIEYALRACDHNLSHVARALRIGRTTLYRKLQAYGIETA